MNGCLPLEPCNKFNLINQCLTVFVGTLIKRYFMKKFLNVFQLPTGYQVRIGKKTKSFNAGVSSDDALNSALSFRLDMYKQGVLPASWNVGYFEPNAIKIIDQDKQKRSRCTIRTKTDRKPTHIEAYWSKFKNLAEAHSFLKREYSKWCREHNAIAKLYNQKRNEILFISAQKEKEQKISILSDGIKFDAKLWNECVAEYEGVMPVPNTISDHVQVEAYSDSGEKDIDLSHHFAVNVSDQLEPYQSSEVLHELLDPVYDILHVDNHAALKLMPEVKCSYKAMREKLRKIKPNRNVKGAICAPFSIETKLKSSFLDFAIPAYWDGLPLNPSKTIVNLASHNGIIQAASLLATASFMFMGYMQKQRMLQSDENVELEFPVFEISEKMLNSAIDSIYQALLLQMGRKALNSMGKCEERLNLWHDVDVCDVYDDQFGTAVQMGQWQCFMPRSNNATLRKLQLLVLVAKIEHNLEEGFVRRQLSKSGIGITPVDKLKDKYSHISHDSIERFEQLRAQLYVSPKKFYPLVNMSSLQTPKPEQVFMARCRHCGHVPNKTMRKKDGVWLGAIQCPNHLDEAVSGEREYEAELHELVIEWQKRNLKNFDFSKTYMWDLSRKSFSTELGPFLDEVKRRLSDMVEYNSLAISLPKEIVKDRPGKNFAKRIYANYLWACFFYDAYQIKLSELKKETAR